MAYTRSRRTTLKRRATYGRGTKRYNRAVYRKAYYRQRRGIGRKEKKGVDVPFPEDSLVASTGTNQGIYLLNGIKKELDHGTESVVIFGTSPSNWT